MCSLCSFCANKSTTTTEKEKERGVVGGVGGGVGRGGSQCVRVDKRLWRGFLGIAGFTAGPVSNTLYNMRINCS